MIAPKAREFLTAVLMALLGPCFAILISARAACKGRAHRLGLFLPLCLFCACCIDEQEQLGTEKRGERHRFFVGFCSFDLASGKLEIKCTGVPSGSSGVRAGLRILVSLIRFSPSHHSNLHDDPGHFMDKS